MIALICHDSSIIKEGDEKITDNIVTKVYQVYTFYRSHNEIDFLIIQTSLLPQYMSIKQLCSCENGPFCIALGILVHISHHTTHLQQLST